MKVEVVDLGIDSPQTFQGFGVATTQFDECVVGSGITFQEAFENALEALDEAVNHSGDFEPLSKLVLAQISDNKLKNIDAIDVDDEVWYQEEDSFNYADHDEELDSTAPLYNYIGIRFSLDK